jgi:stage III sporulation protein AA
LFSMFGALLKKGLYALIAREYDPKTVTEIRLRTGRPVVVQTIYKRGIVHLASGLPYKAEQDDIAHALAVASNHSIYAVNDDLVRGFLHFSGGIRLGACGEGVSERGDMLALKSISSLMLRLPHEVKGCADAVFSRLLAADAKTALIISPPGCGKTTMLRELARLFSYRLNTLIIDERLELAACVGGAATLDTGECDVISGVDKTVAYENTIRAMSPELIVTDELFREREVAAVLDIIRSGVGVLASVHAKNLDALKKSAVFAPLVDTFECFVTLGNNPVGKILDIEFRKTG